MLSPLFAIALSVALTGTPPLLERVHQKRPVDLEGARARLRSLGLKAPLARPELEVWKSRRLLVVRDGPREVRRYPIGLGKEPVGHKEREGDNRTPEGDYRICWRNPKSRFHLFLGLSYPGPGDARAARGRGEIDDRVVREVERAVRTTPIACPPWKTPLGGFVGIHGHGAFADWTAGCIAVNDDDIEELWLLVGLGAPVRIAP